MREKATNTVTVTARSGNIVLESRTDSDGNYSIRMPAGVEFHVTADTFVDGHNIYSRYANYRCSIGRRTDLIFTKSHLVQGSIWLREIQSMNQVSNGAMEFQVLKGTEVIATDSNGLEWRELN